MRLKDRGEEATEPVLVTVQVMVLVELAVRAELSWASENVRLLLFTKKLVV